MKVLYKGGTSDLTSTLCVDRSVISNFPSKLRQAYDAIERRHAAALAVSDVTTCRMLRTLDSTLKVFEKDVLSGEVVHRRDAARVVQV